MTFPNALLWLLVIAIVLVGADAIRRIWKDRTRLHIKIDPALKNLPEPPNSELPNGGARVVKRAPVEQIPLTPAAPPLVMEAADETPVEEPDFGAALEDAALEDAPADVPVAADEPQQPPVVTRPATPAPVQEPARPQVTPVEPPVVRTAPAAPAGTSARPVEKPTAPPAPASGLLEVIVVHLVFTQRVAGERLLDNLLQQGLRFGEMRIFHLHDQGNLLFSMANAHEPGYFNIDTMEQDQLRAVSFFMKLPGPAEPLAALNRMLATAQFLARELEGELRDENRSILTLQMMEHMRERVREFERRMRVPDGR